MGRNLHFLLVKQNKNMGMHGHPQGYSPCTHTSTVHTYTAHVYTHTVHTHTMHTHSAHTYILIDEQT